jgi:SET domain
MGLFSASLFAAAAFSASRHAVIPLSSSSESSHQQHSSSSKRYATTTATTTGATDNNSIDNNDWLQETLQRYNLQIATFADTGRGIQTKSHRPAGELLFSVPSTHVLFPEKCWNEFAHIQRAVQKAESEIPALCNSQILTLALGILQLQQDDDNNNKNSRSNVLLCTLPKQQYSISLMPDTILHCLPPTLARAFTRIQNLHNDAYASIYKSLQDEQHTPDEPDESVSLSASSSFLEKEQKLVSVLKPPTNLDFLWAVASVQSRSFNADISSRQSSWRILLPGIDLINHKFGHDASLNYNADLRQYEFKSNVAFCPHDEVTYSYGKEGADNLSLLSNFGFCIPNNPQRLISFDLRDILNAAQCLIPNIYLDSVINMFTTQLKLENKLLANENLLFAYDGNEQAPHVDLSNAIATVQALGERLAEQSLAGLDAALIKQMLVQRKVDLQESLQRLNDHHHHDENDVDDQHGADWQPFVSSIRTLLQDEMQTLSRLQ